MFSKTHTQHTSIIVLVLLFFITAGCNSASQTPKPTPTPEATAIPPTATPAPAEIIWVSAQPDAAPALTTTINDFATANSLQYRTVPSLDTSGITSGTKIVVLDAAPSNLNELTSAAPATQFVILGSSTAAGGNISVIQTSAVDEAFMAGYLTMLIAEDWRAAALIPNDSPIGDAYADAFTNGARFVCGKCNTFYAPLVEWPQVAAIPTSSDTVPNTIAGLTANWLSSAFIDPVFVNADNVASINIQAFNWEYVALITTDTAPADVDGKWVARLSSDTAASLKVLLSELLAGQSGLTLKAQIIITAPDESIVSPAKQSLFNQVAAELATNQLIPTTIQ